jgi:lipopolysaccharide biosynthesis glycosyltransferase
MDPMNHPHRQPIVIVCGADDQYVQPLAVMLKSALANLSRERTVNLYIIDGGIQPDHKQSLLRSWSRRNGFVRWLLPSESSFTGLPLWGRMPVSTYYKLLITELLPPAVKKAIWLDCDLVVLGDLAQLWDMDLAERHALAVQDPAVPFVSSRDGIAHYQELGLPKDAKYFNAGVMVVNLDLWRRDDIPGRVLDYLRRYDGRVVFLDQEGLNAVLAGKWGELDDRWNHTTSVSERFRDEGRTRDAAKQNHPWIVHFTGNLKPWFYPGHDAAHTLYFRYLDLTAWAGWRPKRSLSGLVLGTYESSGLRHLLYPTEVLGMRLLRSLTRRHASGKEFSEP